MESTNRQLGMVVACLKPIYFNANRVYANSRDQASNITRSITQTGSIIKNPYRIETRHSSLLEIVSTDANCTLIYDGLKKIIGAGRFNLIAQILRRIDLKIIHTGSFQINYYDVDFELDNKIEFPINFYLHDELFVYEDGKLHAMREPRTMTIYFTYSSKLIESLPETVTLEYHVQGFASRIVTLSYSSKVVPFKTGSLCHINIQLLVDQPKLKEFARNPDCTIVHDSRPPSIWVSVHEDKLKEFFDWSRTILPDCKSQGFKDYDAECPENTLVSVNKRYLLENYGARLKQNIEAKIKLLLQSGFLYIENYQDGDSIFDETFEP